jgi:prepilin-type N-terminal cleavage/methylation domain-containing protein
MFKSRQKKGFTLIELLVAIAIIGILATIVLTVLNSTRKKARDAVRWSDMNQISKAMLLYYDAASPNSYPNISNAQQSINVARWNSSGLNKYIVNAPLDPGGSTYYWRDRNLPKTCFCVYVQIESEASRWILANPIGVKKVNSNPNSGNCCIL